MNVKTIVLLFLCLILLLIAPHVYTEWKHTRQIKSKIPSSTEWDYDKEIKAKISSSLKTLDMNQDQSTEQAGYVKVKGVKDYFTEKDLHRILRNKKQNLGKAYTWKWHGVPNATKSAQGLDRLHHFANSYLIGFEPFETKSVWVPLYTLTLRKHYEFDHIQYSGLADVWQNSRQAFYYTRGDCEDHSIILADWLISMGLDARVVLGKVNGKGHAWVILLKDGKEYLLEATSKRKLRSLNKFPLAPMVRGYNPEYQFNRDQFWFNDGNAFTTQYSGDHWKLKSRFVNYNKQT